jgi:hypothetical protein
MPGRTELDAFAALAGLEKGESWSGLLVKTTSRDRWRDAAPKRGAAISRKIVKWRAAADEEGTIVSP